MKNGNYGGALVLTDEQQTICGTNYIAITTIDKKEKPSIEDFKNDFHYLKGVWSDIGSKIVESNAPCEIYTEIDEIKQTIRDNYNAKTIESVLINDVAYFQSVKTFISK
ncbi:MAG: ribonuclease E/G, partial [Flavobacterium sp.]|nr:ribonuclease E/G [Flavobacterium sp.]